MLRQQVLRVEQPLTTGSKLALVTAALRVRTIQTPVLTIIDGAQNCKAGSGTAYCNVTPVKIFS
eukprot:2067933-Amphidinium_carterae.1